MEIEHKPLLRGMCATGTHFCYLLLTLQFDLEVP